MRQTRRWVVTAFAAAIALAACGGGDDATVPGSGSPSGAPTTKGSFTAVVSFGDSLSDLGTYAPATYVTGTTSPPIFFGGKFTTNGGGTGTVWVENVATALGLTITRAQVGFGPSAPVDCPSADATCTGYGQGGSRVTDPNGIGKTGGALTVPVKAQIDKHLARFGGFTANDLIMVFGGNNDVFIQAGTLGAAAAQIQADAAAGRISATEAERRLFAAQTAAQEAMKTAALELASYVKDKILANGGRYVAVWNLPDSSLSPFGSTQTAQSRQVLTDLVDVFNLWLREGLTGQPVQIVDANARFRDVYLNPGRYGIANNTVPACDATKIAGITGGAITDGSSLFCSSTVGAPWYGLRDGADVNTWQFADGVHPTVGGHKLIGDFALQTLRAYGWI